jgi:hypothetical protein
MAGLRRGFGQALTKPWLAWLADQLFFAFRGRSGRLNVHHEVRARDGDSHAYGG